eukprot:5808711-Pyramimonas_sp.AAC.1
MMRVEVGEIVKEDMNDKLEDMKKSIGQLTGKKASNKVAVMGGFQEAVTFQEASDWISSHSQIVGAPAPNEVFYKGEGFNGVVCAKFDAGPTRKERSMNSGARC